jgi:hypothetical protein
MALWIILLLGWLLVFLLAFVLVRVAGYTDRKLRSLANRPRRDSDQATTDEIAGIAKIR